MALCSNKKSWKAVKDKAERKAAKKAYVEAVKFNEEIEVSKFVCEELDKYQHPEFSFNDEQRALIGGNYYPLDFGSFDDDKILAMQFSAENALSGTALIYKRENVTDTKYNVKLNGLIPEKTYNVTDIDNPDKVTSLTGEQLMQEGITLPLPEGRKAIILMFEAK